MKRPQSLRSSLESADRFFEARKRSKKTAKRSRSAADEALVLRETMLYVLRGFWRPENSATVFAVTIETYGRCCEHRLWTTLRYLVRSGDVLQDRDGYRAAPRNTPVVRDTGDTRQGTRTS